MTVLVDTCIVLDALANRAPFDKSAQEIIIQGSEGKITLVISAKSILDLHYILKHYLHDETKVRFQLSNLINAFNVVDTTGISCVTALGSPTTDYEDAVQIETALIEGVDYIITRNTSDFSFSPVPIKTADEFLDIIGS